MSRSFSGAEIYVFAALAVIFLGTKANGRDYSLYWIFKTKVSLIFEKKSLLTAQFDLQIAIAFKNL